VPSTPPSPGIPGWFVAVFVLIAIAGVGTGIWRFAVLRRGGLNPFVAREQLEARLAQSQLLQPPQSQQAPGQQAPEARPSKEQRLAEVDDLYQRGIISAEEHAAGRTMIISGD